MPVAGNLFLKSVQGDSFSTEGLDHWRSPKTVAQVYVRCDAPTQVKLGLEITGVDAPSTIQCTWNQTTQKVAVQPGEYKVIWMPQSLAWKPGYQRITLQGLEGGAQGFGHLKALHIQTSLPDSLWHFVRDNTDSRFYWGRRGPSVHLNYEAPKGKNIKRMYTEIRVPKGQDAIGAYFMANGFSEGYFGIQVNNESERRLLFSVWSPFETDDPAAIPDSDKIKLHSKGNGVYTGEFGNEGSGGQSYLVFPWKADVSYGFLTEVLPRGDNYTQYTSWFYDPEKKRWMKIASFLRPKTNTWLQRPHSFLENFDDSRGDQVRSALYGPVWLMEEQGTWHPVTKATFTGDDIARRKYRTDYQAGMQDLKFFWLRHCGFFSESTPLRIPLNVKTPRKIPQVLAQPLPE